MYCFHLYPTGQWHSRIFACRTMLEDWKRVWNLEHLWCKHHFSILLRKEMMKLPKMRAYVNMCYASAQQTDEGMLFLEAPDDGRDPVMWLLWAETYIPLQSHPYQLWFRRTQQSQKGWTCHPERGDKASEEQEPCHPCRDNTCSIKHLLTPGKKPLELPHWDSY